MKFLQKNAPNVVSVPPSSGSVFLMDPPLVKINIAPYGEITCVKTKGVPYNGNLFQSHWTYLFLSFGAVIFAPLDISQTSAHEVVDPGWWKLTSFKNSTDWKCHLARWNSTSRGRNKYVHWFTSQKQKDWSNNRLAHPLRGWRPWEIPICHF